jgi:hypothetical protein
MKTDIVYLFGIVGVQSRAMECFPLVYTLTVEIPEGWEVHTRKNPIFGPNFFTAS